jgi:hypothetical protein
MPKTSKAPRKKAASARSTKPIPKRSLATVKDIGPKTKIPRSTAGPRRIVFIDVENTSSEAALLGALEQVKAEPAAARTELVAVGNWRVIGQHVARMLAQRGARLLHTAPATGVKDWSDLWIAVAAGIWLGRAGPGDEIEIISADRAFDAVADAASHLGVRFRRLTYGPLSGLAEAIVPAEVAGGGRRRRRGGRSRRRSIEPPRPWAAPAPPTPSAPAASEVAPTAALPPSNGVEANIHGATPEQIIATIARLTARHPERGVNLDLLINALKAEGFGRPPGSPRLVTRLRKMKDVEVMPTGMVRLVNLPPGPLPEIPAEQASAAADEAPGAPPSARERAGDPLRASRGVKRPRRRGGRSRRGRARTSEAAAASTTDSPGGS